MAELIAEKVDEEQQIVLFEELFRAVGASRQEALLERLLATGGTATAPQVGE
ncbi:hypothetical protein [Streptomyces sp. LN699]|uniref:hypothetical protein n=1 Tax=Streptomyces sp. LN699 TaxID=3112981 RepID=UPI00371CFFE1